MKEMIILKFSISSIMFTAMVLVLAIASIGGS